MKVEGLGEARRAELSQIRTLVEEVSSFSSEQYNRMVDQYKAQDAIMHQVLVEATKVADANYTRYLNGILAGGKLALSFISKEDVAGESPVLSKMMSEMRDRLKNESDYRKQFLGPQIGKQTQTYEIQLRKVQKLELKAQRAEQRAVSKEQGKGLRLFDFGL